MPPQNKPIAPSERLRPKKKGMETSKEDGNEAIESASASVEERGSSQAVAEPVSQVVVVTPQQATVYVVKSETLKKIESILEEHIGETYAKLTSEQQEVIKREGEFTAKKIEELIVAAKATAVKVFNLILRFFEFIPGVNKWFSEQEAKIKTDKIMKLQKAKQ